MKYLLVILVFVLNAYSEELIISCLEEKENHQVEISMVPILLSNGEQPPYEEVMNLSNLFDSSIIKMLVINQAGDLIEQSDFFSGEINYKDNIFDLTYRSSGFFRLHKMQLLIDFTKGTGRYEERKKGMRAKKKKILFGLKECTKEAANL